MKTSFPAMRGFMGNRVYYTAMVKLRVVPKLFQFRDWDGIPAEQRAQRVLQKNRVPEIASYIVDNPEDYVFSALTASYEGKVTFKPFGDTDSEIGELEISLEKNLIINDGQHRRAAIEEALKQDASIEDHSIAVVLFPYEDINRVQQIFSDLNRTAKPTSKSLNILFNHRDDAAQVTLSVIENVPTFRDLTEKDKQSLSQRSPRLFTLAGVHDANLALLGSVSSETKAEKEKLAIEYWTALTAQFPIWRRCSPNAGDLKAKDVRTDYIHCQSVVLWALGSLGQTLLMHRKDDWKEVLSSLRAIRWERTNVEWQRIAMIGTQVINRRTNREDTASFIKKKLGLPLTPNEERSLRAAMDPDAAINDLMKFAPITETVGDAK
ncbi:MAG TPA: DNA sulfur modification protein DndB [Pirellulaceae bacterium]|nr:DNA sulfur modification protein DndB [Pirellulaceae bacterium]